MAVRADDHPGLTVDNGVLRYVSVSQVTTFDPNQYSGCERRWYFEKVMRLERPTTQAQQTGIDVHAQIEHYLKSGEDVLGIVARQGMRFIPKPHPDYLIEHRFGDVKIVKAFDHWRAQGKPLGDDAAPLVAAGVPFIGYIDLVNPTGLWLDDEGEEHVDYFTTIELEDWKTTSSIESYAKQAHELPQTVQMLGYAKWAARHYPNAREFRLSHGYFQTRGRGSEKRTVLVDLDTVEQRWQTVVSTVARMVEVARETDPMKVTPNHASCSAYRGCPFRERCPRSKEQVLADAFGGTGGSNMSLLAKLKAQTTTPPATDTKAKAEEQAKDERTGVKPEIQDAIKAEVEKIKAEERGTCPKDGTALTPENSSKLPDGRVVHVPCPGAVLPPDAPKSEPPNSAKEVPADVKATLSPELQKAAESFEQPKSTEAPTEPKRRSRKAASDAQPAPDALAASAKSEEFAEFCKTARQLYIDVSIYGMPVPALEPYIQEACDTLCKQFGAADVRCAPPDSALGFGKWKGALAAYVRQYPPPAGIWCVRGVKESEIKQVVVEALESLCQVIVRGF